MDKDEIIKFLVGDEVANLSGVNYVGTSQVMRFTASRPNSNGDPQKVTIEVKDTPADGSARYFCSAKSDEYKGVKIDGPKEAYGNSGDNLYAVTKNVHWKDLD